MKHANLLDVIILRCEWSPLVWLRWRHGLCGYSTLLPSPPSVFHSGARRRFVLARSHSHWADCMLQTGEALFQWFFRLLLQEHQAGVSTEGPDHGLPKLTWRTDLSACRSTILLAFFASILQAICLGMQSYEVLGANASPSSIPWPPGSLGHHRWLQNQFPPFFSVLHCPLGLAEHQAFPFLDAVIPPLFLSCQMFTMEQSAAPFPNLTHSYNNWL